MRIGVQAKATILETGKAFPASGSDPLLGVGGLRLRRLTSTRILGSGAFALIPCLESFCLPGRAANSGNLEDSYQVKSHTRTFSV